MYMYIYIYVYIYIYIYIYILLLSDKRKKSIWYLFILTINDFILSTLIPFIMKLIS